MVSVLAVMFGASLVAFPRRAAAIIEQLPWKERGSSEPIPRTERVARPALVRVCGAVLMGAGLAAALG